MNQLRRIFYQVLETSGGRRSGLSRAFNLLLVSIIALNALAIVLHTVKPIDARFPRLFVDFELFSVIFFTIEYGLRLWVCVENERYRHPVWGRLRYVVSLGALVHLLAVLPFYLSHFASDTGLLRILRVFRILRLFRITRYSHALRIIQNVVQDKKEELVLSTVFIFFVLIISSSIMFYIEHESQPTIFSSIPATLWWGVSTLTTVGYGDAVPNTTMGKFFGGIIAFMGVGLFALPTGILASGFAEAMTRKRNGGIKSLVCPHCGKEVHRPDADSGTRVG
ncbi:MAG: ion transporter [Cytophagaceae bacterium]|nr:ion transporter [Cytophagaceae bacterium]